jgi:hypothetical protein
MIITTIYWPIPPLWCISVGERPTLAWPLGVLGGHAQLLARLMAAQALHGSFDDNQLDGFVE